MLCQRCDRPVDEFDIFCGECGTLIVRQEPASSAPTPSSPAVTSQSPAPRVAPSVPPLVPEVLLPAAAVEPSVNPSVKPSVKPVAELSVKATIAAPAGEPSQFELEPEIEIISEDLEVTRIVRSAHQRGPKFELVFSTGGSFIVSGAGLLGRNPQALPEEKFEQLVLFRDPNRTVSKTHLEFGTDQGIFWVRDRNSVNGSYLLSVEDETLLEECTPGERYSISDGGKVGIGDEHFVIHYR